MMEVRGTYYFKVRATKPLTALMSYPFYIDTDCPYPDSVDIIGHAYTPNDTAVTFVMRFSPSGEDSFSAYYRQRLGSRQARYIVTSTRRWQAPIDTAEFRVTVPLEFEDVDLSYEPDSVVWRESLVDYYFTRRRFWPDRDLIVKW